MSDEKLYAQRDHRALEPHFSRHVSAIVSERLFTKHGLAAELAWRDREIERLRAALAQPENRPCTCHPDDNPPQPCAQRYALTECKALAQPEAEPVVIGPEWTPCVKLPIVVHVREQRPDEQHVSTREGITPAKPDDLIMRGVAGEEYPIGRELFAKTYRIGDKLPPDDAEPVAWAVACDGSAVEARLTETAANLIAQNLREKNRARGFDWRVRPLYLHPPRDDWRPASEVPEDAMFSRGAVAAIVAGAIYDFAGFMTTRHVSVSIGASDACGPVVDLITSFAEKRGLDLEEAAVQSWNLCLGRDVQPPTEGA